MNYEKCQNLFLLIVRSVLFIAWSKLEQQKSTQSALETDKKQSFIRHEKLKVVFCCIN